MIWHVFLPIGSKTDQPTHTPDAAAPGNQAYLIFFGALVNGVTRFVSEPTLLRTRSRELMLVFEHRMVSRRRPAG
jgi:hypothetical protein